MQEQFYENLIRPLAPSGAASRSRAFLYLKVREPGCDGDCGTPLPALVNALESNWLRDMLAEAVLINGSGAFSGRGYNPKPGGGEPRGAAMAALRPPDDGSLAQSFAPNETVCKRDRYAHDLDLSSSAAEGEVLTGQPGMRPEISSSMQVALALAWCADAIERYELSSGPGNNFSVVAYARPDQYFAHPVRGWCTYPIHEHVYACQGAALDGFWVAPRGASHQLLSMLRALASCGLGSGRNQLPPQYHCNPQQEGAIVPDLCKLRKYDANRLSSCCAQQNEHLFSHTLHAPTRLPLARGSCHELLPTTRHMFLRKGTPSCVVLSEQFERASTGASAHRDWAKHFVQGVYDRAAIAPHLAHALRDLFLRPNNVSANESVAAAGAGAVAACEVALQPVGPSIDL